MLASECTKELLWFSRLFVVVPCRPNAVFRCCWAAVSAAAAKCWCAARDGELVVDDEPVTLDDGKFGKDATELFTNGRALFISGCDE